MLSLDTLFTLPRFPVEPSPGRALHPDGDRFTLAVTGREATAGDDAAPQRIILIQNFFTELLERVPIR